MKTAGFECMTSDSLEKSYRHLDQSPFINNSLTFIITGNGLIGGEKPVTFVITDSLTATTEDLMPYQEKSNRSTAREMVHNLAALYSSSRKWYLQLLLSSLFLTVSSFIVVVVSAVYTSLFLYFFHSFNDADGVAVVYLREEDGLS